MDHPCVRMARYVTESNSESGIEGTVHAAKPNADKDFPALYLLGTKVHLTE
jgi:hypothetical protein